MNNDDLTGYRIFEGELKGHALAVLKAMVNDGVEDDTDTYFLSLPLRQSLSVLVPC